MSEVETNTKPRGFAAMTPERRKEVASMGGKSSKPENRWFARHRDAAKIAGEKGGASLRKKLQEPEATDEQGDH